jgi:hypothetical protein
MISFIFLTSFLSTKGAAASEALPSPFKNRQPVIYVLSDNCKQLPPDGIFLHFFVVVSL